MWSNPFSVPGTATEPSPTLKSCLLPENWTVTGKKWGSGTLFSRPTPGVSTKKSKKRLWSCAAECPKSKPPPPKLFKAGSTTQEAKPAATTASKALPPSFITVAAASLTSECPEATMDFVYLLIPRTFHVIV